MLLRKCGIYFAVHGLKAGRQESLTDIPLRATTAERGSAEKTQGPGCYSVAVNGNQFYETGFAKDLIGARLMRINLDGSA